MRAFADCATRVRRVASREPGVLTHDEFGTFTFAIFDGTCNTAVMILRDGEQHAQLPAGWPVR